MWQQASDWALRRLVKALLKRHLKHVLATELDVEQLRISLGRGALELRDVLVSPEWLKEHAVSCSAHVCKASYVGQHVAVASDMPAPNRLPCHICSHQDWRL